MTENFSGSLKLSLALDTNVTQSFEHENARSQWSVVSEGLWQGFKQRVEEAKEHPLATALEVGLAAGLAGIMTKATAAEGAWRIAGQVLQVGTGTLMAADMGRRALGIYDAYSSSENDVKGQVLRQDAIARYAGTALFDYPLIAGSGALGRAITLDIFPESEMVPFISRSVTGDDLATRAGLTSKQMAQFEFSTGQSSDAGNIYGTNNGISGSSGGTYGDTIPTSPYGNPPQQGPYGGTVDTNDPYGGTLNRLFKQ